MLEGGVLLIVKPRETPVHMLQMEALNRRLPHDHHKKEAVSNMARNLRTGYEGEKSLDFTLSFLPTEKFHIFHNLRIQDEHGVFEMDTLIISHYFVLILEVKNVYGTITFDGMGQVIRMRDDGSEDGFSNPIEQVTLQEHRLRNWLRDHEFPPFPIEKLVVYSHANTIIRNIKNSEVIELTVIHKERLRTKIDEFLETYHVQLLTNEHVESMSQQLLAAHVEKKENALERYEIEKADIMRGVFCPSCQAMPMSYAYGSWNCRVCQFFSKSAHMAALDDYGLLIDEKINNRQAREFVKIDSIHVMKKLLMKAGYKYVGNTSGRKYILR